MLKTCLYPFYKYIIECWVQSGTDFPEYKKTRQGAMASIDKGQNRLEQRKKQIWEKTREILNKSSLEEQCAELDCLKKREVDCGLCNLCEQCENYYWKQLELALKERCSFEVYEKCEFLLPKEIDELLEQKDRPVDIYRDFYSRRNMREENCLVMLKGFSSSTPILLNYAKNTNFYSGGGFYVRWNGMGIAIDPGYLFVQNLHNMGLSVLDIDVVIVTHEHIDHSSDIRLLDDLHYNAASNHKEDKKLWHYEDFTFVKKEVPNHTINWYLDAVTYEEALLFRSKQSGFEPAYNKLHCIIVDESEKTALNEKDKDNNELNFPSKYFQTKPV